jgi:hypothetical protein
MSALWVEYDASDDSGAARWESVTDEQIDAIVAYAQQVIGRTPDTVA